LTFKFSSYIAWCFEPNGQKRKSCGIPKEEWNNRVHQMFKGRAIGVIVCLWGKVGYAINDGQFYAAPRMPLFL
jgi:hypothetical protein